MHRCPGNRVQELSSFYAHVIGNGSGILITVCLFHVNRNSKLDALENWWLVIGTYTSLFGFIDGFVLREILYSITHYEQSRF